MSFFTDIQDEIKDYLEAVAWFSDIPIVIEETGTVEGDLDKALAEGAMKPNSSSKCGAAILIITPSGTPTENAPYIPESDIEFMFGVIEQPSVNRAASGIGKTGLEIVARLAVALTNENPSDDPSVEAMRWGGFTSTEDPKHGELYYIVRFFQRRVITV